MQLYALGKSCGVKIRVIDIFSLQIFFCLLKPHVSAIRGFDMHKFEQNIEKNDLHYD